LQQLLYANSVENADSSDYCFPTLVINGRSVQFSVHVKRCAFSLPTHLVWRHL
jgi:hypothetical protein